MLHLLNETMLDEYLSSPRRERAIMNHIRQCTECQAKAREGRLLRLLLHKPHGSPPDDHLQANTLAQFSEEQLNDYQTMQVMGHLAKCEQCLAQYRELHELLCRQSYAPVPEQLVDRAMAAFTADVPTEPIPWGRLLIERLSSGFRLSLDRRRGEPLTSPSMLVTDNAGFYGDAARDDATYPSPRESPRPTVSKISMSMKKDVNCITQRPSASRRMRNGSPAAGPVKTRPVHLEAGASSVTITDHIEDGRHTLEVLVNDDVPDFQAPYIVAVSTLLGEECHTGITGAPQHIPLPADALALRFSGEAFEQPIALELQLPKA